jgi:hypothetical protein
MNRHDKLSYRQRVAVLIGLLLLGLAGLLLVDPIPQDPAYHQFADTRSWLGIPNFFNVVSNLGFALVGVLGLVTLIRKPSLFHIPGDARPYLVFFTGVTLIGLGSAFYHWSPSNGSLLWDRFPMSVAFMALAAAIVADRIHRRAGNGWLLVLLVSLGIGSLLYWYVTELQGRGDLRLYAFVQFYPVVMLLAIIWLFPDSRYTAGRYIGWVFVWYGLAKLLEHNDAAVFSLLGETVSGHTLKHLAAAGSALVVLRMLQAGAGRQGISRLC